MECMFLCRGMVGEVEKKIPFRGAASKLKDNLWDILTPERQA